MQELQRQIQACSPCPAPSGPQWERRLEEALRENVALRRLLKALGIDEHSQQQYLEASTKREPVDSILVRDGQRYAAASPQPHGSGEDWQKPVASSPDTATLYADTGSDFTRNLSFLYGGAGTLDGGSLEIDLNASDHVLSLKLQDVLTLLHRSQAPHMIPTATQTSKWRPQS